RPSAHEATVSMPQLDPIAVKPLTRAQKLSTELGDVYVTTEHIPVGLAEDGGSVATLLQRHGATPQAIQDAFTTVRGSARVSSPDPEGTFKALEKYGLDLTAS